MELGQGEIYFVCVLPRFSFKVLERKVIQITSRLEKSWIFCRVKICSGQHIALRV